MDPLVHVGMDLAWGPRNKTGLAAVGERGVLLASTTVRADDEIVAWVGQHAPRVGVVAIDAPLIVQNREGSRPCERAIQAAFGRFDAGGYPSNTSNLHFNPPRALTLAHRLGLGVDPHAAVRERVAIEVYPHPAMVGIFRLGRTIKYKRKKQGFDLQLAETRRLLDLMEGLELLRLRESDDWSAIRAAVAAATVPGALGRVEDEIDGIFCAHLAWLWARGSDVLEVHGDVDDGYIVAPPEPTWAPTPRLRGSSQDPSTTRREDVVMTDRRARQDPAAIAELWARLDVLLDRLPEGRWTTYGDVAAALSHYPQPVSGRIAKVRPGRYWRVIRVDGTVSSEFTWRDGRKDRDRSVLGHLQSEGVRIVDGRASSLDRLTVEELRELLA